MPSVGATDVFSLGGGFHPQTSEINNSRDIVDVLNANGDVQCQTGFNTRNEVSVEYEVCGQSTLSISIGGVVNGYIVRLVEYSHEAGQAPVVRVEGIKYDGGETVSTRTYAISQAINPALIVSPLTGTDPTSATRRWECEISEAMGANGQVKFAASRTVKEFYEEEGTGELASAPAYTDFIVSGFDNSQSNQEFNTYSVSYERGHATS